MKPMLLCAVLLSCLFTACKKDKEEPTDRSSNKITATIQVANITPLFFSVTGEAADIKPVYPGSTAYHLYAKDSANRTLFIYLPDVKAAGTYPLPPIRPPATAKPRCNTTAISMEMAWITYTTPLPLPWRQKEASPLRCSLPAAWKARLPPGLKTCRAKRW